MSITRNKPKILVVDDAPENIHILLQTLKDEYAVTAATSGEKALSIAFSDAPPHLILLDIQMPGIDGYEVCRRLKDNSATKDIPIIFVTALDEAVDETKGLALGAIDYITKPFNPGIVRARVGNHLNLVEAMRIKDDVDLIMRHDLKNPLTVVITNPYVLRMSQTIGEAELEMLNQIEIAGYTMLNMINSSLDMFKIEKGTYKAHNMPFDLAKTLRLVIKQFTSTIEDYELTLEVLMDDVPLAEDDIMMASGVEMLCHTALSNLIKNALEASDERDRVTITLGTDDFCDISIHNKTTVPVALRDSFFEKYATADKMGGTGLGTYSARLFIETIGGQVHMLTSEDHGTTVSVQIPLGD